VHLSNNQITALPESVGNLTSLGGLYLSGNQLTKLPDSVRKLKNLSNVEISENFLKPDEMKRLTGLLPDCNWSFE
jgi:Leucine-rich repeat (LRR) protein